MPGVRLGWVVGPDEVVERLWARTDYTTIAPPSVSDALARIALSPGVRPRILERTQAIIRRNLALLTSWIDASGGLFTFTPPDAGAISMIRYHSDLGSLELAERLRVEQSLLIVPGAHFGIDSTMRLGFGPSAGGVARRAGTSARGLRPGTRPRSGRWPERRPQSRYSSTSSMQSGSS